MRLQTENRRQSGVITPLDLSRANLSPPSKRASFTPLTGSFAGRPTGHRRISSVSDSGLQALSLNLGLSPDAHSQVLTMPNDNTNMNPSPMSSRRMSGFFGGRSSGMSPSQAHDIFTESAELQDLRKEISSLRSDLEETRHELSEAVEAREASETCVTALRAFIEDNNVGNNSGSDAASIKLPPLPASTTGNEAETASSKAGWGFKLWNAKPNNGPPSASVDPSPTIPAQTPAQVTKKIGGFFSRNLSISSVTTPVVPTALQNAHRESMYSYESRSDTSSIPEPLSPTSDVDDNVVVRESSSRSTPHDLVPVDLGAQKVAEVNV